MIVVNYIYLTRSLSLLSLSVTWEETTKGSESDPLKREREVFLSVTWGKRKTKGSESDRLVDKTE